MPDVKAELEAVRMELQMIRAVMAARAVPAAPPLLVAIHAAIGTMPFRCFYLIDRASTDPVLHDALRAEGTDTTIRLGRRLGAWARRGTGPLCVERVGRDGAGWIWSIGRE